MLPSHLAKKEPSTPAAPPQRTAAVSPTFLATSCPAGGDDDLLWRQHTSGCEDMALATWSCTQWGHKTTPPTFSFLAPDAPHSRTSAAHPWRRIPAATSTPPAASSLTPGWLTNAFEHFSRLPELALDQADGCYVRAEMACQYLLAWGVPASSIQRVYLCYAKQRRSETAAQPAPLGTNRYHTSCAVTDHLEQTWLFDPRMSGIGCLEDWRTKSVQIFGQVEATPAAIEQLKTHPCPYNRILSKISTLQETAMTPELAATQQLIIAKWRIQAATRELGGPLLNPSTLPRLSHFAASYTHAPPPRQHEFVLRNLLHCADPTPRPCILSTHHIERLPARELQHCQRAIGIRRWGHLMRTIPARWRAIISQTLGHPCHTSLLSLR